MKIGWMLMVLTLSLFAKDIVVFENEFTLFQPSKPFSKVLVGNSDLLNVSVMEKGLKLFGKKAGNTSMLVVYNDGSVENLQIYVNQNLGFIQKMINTIAPNVTLARAGNGSVVVSGVIDNPHQKNKVFELLGSAGLEINATMDLTKTAKVAKMVRTKLYLVSIDNDKALEMGGALGLNYVAKDGKIALNNSAQTYATFSGFLLDNTLKFANTGKSLLANLSFLQTNGVAKILDDTVLLSTEDQNASFHVGGEVYIPVGITYSTGTFPTINLEEKEYGLRLTMRPNFLEKENFLGIKVEITDSEFDTDPTHRVQLGDNIFVPAFRAKNISTDVVAQSGQVIALGGRLHTEQVEQQEKIPILGDIPVVGNLFKRNADSTRSNDLIFFLVPEIVDGNEAVDERSFYNSFKEDSKSFHETVETPPSDISLILGSSEHNASAVIIENETPLVDTNPPTINSSEPIISETKRTLSRNHYVVTSPYLNIRDVPITGKVLKVWKKGHVFVGGERMMSDGVEWIKIIESCQNNLCTPVDETMWISKNRIRIK